jgi:hypothetical protein
MLLLQTKIGLYSKLQRSFANDTAILGLREDSMKQREENKKCSELGEP